MPITYKTDILLRLKECGYSTYRLRKEHLLAESTIQAIRGGEMISIDNIGRICEMLNCQPGDILEFISDKTSEN